MIGRTNLLISKFYAKRNKILFQVKCLNLINSIPLNRKIDLEIISFSGLKYFEDQIYSILSFYYNVGIPLKWVVYSDGTYTEMEKNILFSIPNVEIREVNLNIFNNSWTSFFEKIPTLKKVAILTEQVIKQTTLFLDSDIIFYPSFIKYFNEIKFHNWYLEDEKASYFDEDYLKNNPIIEHPLNFGMVILNANLNWQCVLDYLAEKIHNKSLSYWSDQTALHILANTEGSDFYPLSKNNFVVNGSDSFKLGHDFNYKKIALRHFVGPVRHKMWQYPWKKVLGVK